MSFIVATLPRAQYFLARLDNAHTAEERSAGEHIGDVASKRRRQDVVQIKAVENGIAGAIDDSTIAECHVSVGIVEL